MSKVVYRANIRIERERGPRRKAHLPADVTVTFGVHGAIAEHYGVEGKEEDPTTLDHVIAATGGWLTGTFGGALEAREIDASDGRLTADVVGEVEKEDGVLVIRRIHVTYRLEGVDPEARKTVERVHEVHARHCPVYRTLHGCIDITTEVELV